MRVPLDRDGPLYHAIYDQRTSTERDPSQSQELGIKRPKVRNLDSICNLNPLTYLVINARALRRIRALNATCSAYRSAGWPKHRLARGASLNLFHRCHGVAGAA